MSQITNKHNYFSIFPTLPLNLIHIRYVIACTKHYISLPFAIGLVKNFASLDFNTYGWIFEHLVTKLIEEMKTSCASQTHLTTLLINLTHGCYTSYPMSLNATQHSLTNKG